MLVEPHTRFAASNAHPRLNILPRRESETLEKTLFGELSMPALCHHIHNLYP